MCFHVVTQTQFQCGHRMCPSCTREMLHHDGRCAFCRRTITSCHPTLIDCTGVPNAFCIELVRTVDGEMFGITIGNDMTVTRVDKHGVAYATGVRRGHLLLEVNGIPCYDTNVVISMIRERGVFRLYLHRRPEVMHSSPCTGTSGWMGGFLPRRRMYM